MHAFRSILLAVTRQHTSDMELQQAFRLALDNRATLLIALFDQSLETLNHLQFIPLEKKLEDHLRQQLEDELERLKAMAWEQGIEAETLVVPGRPRQAIHKVIKDHHIDLVIKLADASGALTRKQLTGNDLALLRKCPVPILMMADRDQLPDFSGKIIGGHGCWRSGFGCPRFEPNVIAIWGLPGKSGKSRFASGQCLECSLGEAFPENTVR